MSATQSTLGAAGLKSRATRSSATRTPGTRIVVRPPLLGDQAADRGLAHESLDALAPNPDPLGHPQPGVDAPRAIDAAGGRVDGLDAFQQPHSARSDGGRRSQS
jgi:hypothetical protein